MWERVPPKASEGYRQPASYAIDKKKLKISKNKYGFKT